MENQSQQSKNESMSIETIGSFLRLLVQSEVEARLIEYFADPKELRIYELSNGERSTREIAELTISDKDRVSALWNKWQKQGIADQLAKQRPYIALFSVIDLALLCPKSKG